MYYRYEIKNKDAWDGIFTIANPDWRRYINRYIKEPKWYKKQENKNKQSRCWFTEYGFIKYNYLMTELIQDYKIHHPDADIRILQKETLNNLTMTGKIQVIELL